MLIVVMLSIAMLSVMAPCKITSNFLNRIGAWDQCFKTLLSVIYHFRTKLECFVRLGWKSLPGTNTLADYKN
jgi:hypothetical protein